ncbi:MAG TPA: type II toxin-antitoxin system RatA family toxin [Dokdonella sp.]|uniref:type II toxin-antitoxin system RatA family toxin n=1 Tax=Dokdonella sp. TaxID=2291710 RepID=UPI002CF57296|nr:type II toxin-antitoxin system RatA family toxin [Dokdonella sp.]HUD41921.1 type II toxin-antitoxin system RatA family toxin [Dokdonella sp.]
MTHISRSALVRYTPRQMFDLVNDVEAYPSRFRWCSAAQVLERDEAGITARLDLRLAGIVQSFTTRNLNLPPDRIQMRFVDGPFKTLEGVWAFQALGEAGSKVSLTLDFEFASRLAGAALRIGFQGLADRMVDDFCRVARDVYG